MFVCDIDVDLFEVKPEHAKMVIRPILDALSSQNAGGACQ